MQHTPSVKNCPEVDDIFHGKILNLRTLQTMQFYTALSFILSFFLNNNNNIQFCASHILPCLPVRPAIFKTNIKKNEWASQRKFIHTYKHTIRYTICMSNIYRHVVFLSVSVCNLIFVVYAIATAMHFNVYGFVAGAAAVAAVCCHTIYMLILYGHVNFDCSDL